MLRAYLLSIVTRENLSGFLKDINNVAFFKGAVMQEVNLSDCSYPPTENGTWAGFTHWSVFPLGCLTFIKNGWEDHSGNFTINQNCQASLFLKVMHGRSTTIQKRFPDPGSDSSSVWNFCALFSDVIWGGKPVMASPNVGCFLRVLDRKPLLNLR